MAVFHLGPGALPPLGPPGAAVRWPPVLAENSTRLDTSRPGPAFGISCHPEFDLSFPKKSIKLLNTTKNPVNCGSQDEKPLQICPLGFVSHGPLP